MEKHTDNTQKHHIDVRVEFLDSDDFMHEHERFGATVTVGIDQSVDLARFGGSTGLQQLLDHPDALLPVDEPSVTNVIALADAVSGETWHQRNKRWARDLGLNDRDVMRLAIQGLSPAGLALLATSRWRGGFSLYGDDLIQAMLVASPWDDPAAALTIGESQSRRQHLVETLWWVERMVAAAPKVQPDELERVLEVQWSRMHTKITGFDAGLLSVKADLPLWASIELARHGFAASSIGAALIEVFDSGPATLEALATYRQGMEPCIISVGNETLDLANPHQALDQDLGRVIADLPCWDPMSGGTTDTVAAAIREAFRRPLPHMAEGFMTPRCTVDLDLDQQTERAIRQQVNYRVARFVLEAGSCDNA